MSVHLVKRATSVAELIWSVICDQIGDTLIKLQFPRDMESLIWNGFEIPVVRQPKLTLQSAKKFLCALYLDECEDAGIQDRSVYGLLHIGPPTNIIFVQDGLPFNITNYILAHEIAHFFADFYVIQALWEKTLPAQRNAVKEFFTWYTKDEKLELAAAVKGLPPRPHSITGRGQKNRSETSEREILADLIARELLAPQDIAEAQFQPDKVAMLKLLDQKFGLPKRIASYYYQDLNRRINPPSDTISRLFGPLIYTSKKTS